jgi:NDP-sugar pyrophosphorylase family protein
VGLAELDPRTQRVTRWSEKPQIDHLVSTGAYVLTPGILRLIERFGPEARDVDLPADVFPAVLADGASIRGFARDVGFWDIGRIDDYDALVHSPSPEVDTLLRGLAAARFHQAAA